MSVPPFARILAQAEQHHGKAGLATKLAAPPDQPIASLDQTDDRFLAAMARAVFSAGFSWDVIDKKWPGFEVAFDGFDPRKVAAYGEPDLDRLLKDKGIVRNGAKIQATIANARFVAETGAAHGSFSAFLRAWPTTDQAGLLDHLKKHASHLGGTAAQYFLRFNGWDAYILSRDVTRALIREGIVDAAPTSKSAMKAVQEAFNAWTAETGRPQREISRILALSVG